MATEAKSFKTGDFMLSKWEEEIEGEGTETQWLPVRLGNHNEENGSWEVLWLIRKMVILIYMPCIKNSRATSKNMVCNVDVMKSG